MAFRFLLSPPPLPLPSSAAASSYLVSVHHGRRGRRPLEHGCRCGRPPETAPSNTSSSGGVGSYDREASCRPVGLEGGASSSGYQSGLARLAVSFYLKDDLHLDPAETAVISGFSALPWLVKPLYGFISDSIPLFGYRRRSYLILSGLLGALSWSLMATIVDDKYSAALSIVLGSLAVAVSDVVVDSMVVERARGESQSTSGSLQSLCWGSSAFGGVVSAYFSGSLVDTYGVRFVFGVTALLPLMTSAVAVLVNEERLPLGERSISVSGSELIKNSKLRIMQLWNSVLLVTGLNRELGISDEWFTLGDSLIITVLGQASFMPVLVLAAKLCPPGVEATLFATLMSISNAGGVAGGLVGAGLTQLLGVTRDDFGNLALLIAVSNLSSLLPLPLLNLLPDESPDAENTQAKND
ncbi:hypothetical protein PR202_gb10656 [Eleusine coracana subsp. coracana]|uniref:Biopterin transport-related protein BT1 n=1 Tax=Eleusine coracana subsp. coracana TaxID=191504 RepID=A0AAV5EKT8_ELECO|nr:hypothetical protein PR202_gb10656 [Eleusine coracana subsp. coracana]